MVLLHNVLSYVEDAGAAVEAAACSLSRQQRPVDSPQAKDGLRNVGSVRTQLDQGWTTEPVDRGPPTLAALGS